MSFPYLRHPLVVFCLLLTLVNDHYLKYHFAGLLTGKISDFTGLFYFPLFLYAVMVFIRKPSKKHISINLKNLCGCIFATDLVFILLKFSFLRPLFVEYFSKYAFPVQITPDWTDLAALSASVGTYYFAKKFSDRNSLSGH